MATIYRLQLAFVLAILVTLARAAPVLVDIDNFETTRETDDTTASPEFCVDDKKGWVTALSNPCPSGSSPLRGVGANLFDVFWGAWGTAGPNATLDTSLQALRDAGASGVRFARAFAAPYTYVDWAWFNTSTRDAYWKAATAVIEQAERSNVKLIASMGHGCPDVVKPCNPAHVLFNETYREFITNNTSRTRAALRSYAQEFVSRFKGSSAILFWELGNEMNLVMDGCTYDKSDGAYFTTEDGLQYLKQAAADIKAVDGERPVNTGMGAPRLRAKHIMNTPGRGRSCVTADNPHGDCELCYGVDPDSEQDSMDMVRLYYNDFDMVSMHFYGCSPPYGNYSWCNDDVMSTRPIDVMKKTADGMDKPLYIGEFGPSSLNWSLPSTQGRVLLSHMADANVQLSTMWAFECPSHDHVDMKRTCLHPGDVDAQPYTRQVLQLMDETSRTLQGLPARDMNMSLHWLPRTTAINGVDHVDEGDSTADRADITGRGRGRGRAACLDGSRYGYYALEGRVNKWVVMLQGGGWCFSVEDCHTRTQSSYAGGNLGSSSNWLEWAWGWDFGPDFADWGVLYFPYCDGASYSGNVDAPVPYNATTNLYFRGQANFAEALEDAMKRYAISKPDEVVVTGGSAGGLSTTLHTDKIGDTMQALSVVGVPQCGWFPIYDEPCDGPTHREELLCNATDNFRTLTEIHNVSASLSTECLAAQSKSTLWQCFMASIATPFVKAPLFIWQSKFDHFQLREFLAADCAFEQEYMPPWDVAPVCSVDNTAAIKEYGKMFMKQLHDVVTVKGPQRAVYLTSCVLHGMDFHYLTIGDNAAGELGVTPAVAFNTWYRDVMAMKRNKGPASGQVTTSWSTLAPDVTSDVDWKWIEDLELPRVDNPMACPPFVFSTESPEDARA